MLSIAMHTTKPIVTMAAVGFDLYLFTSIYGINVSPISTMGTLAKY